MLGEDADCFRAAYVDGVVIALPGEDVGDPVDGGFEPDGITGGGAGDDYLQPVFAVAAEAHKPFLGSEGCLLFGAERVGFDDRGLEQGVQPAPGQLSHGRGELRVHPAGLCGGEVPGCGSDVAGLVGRHLPGQRGRPNRAEPVPQVQRVCDQPGRRAVGHAQHATQFGGTEPGDGRGAVPA